MPWLYESTIGGSKVLVIDTDSREELTAIKDWCRANLGRSHGPYSGSWCVTRVKACNARMRDHNAVAIKDRQAWFHAQMVWG